ncbi:hypothetical protein [uncultured Deefgea sp.]|uniref:hypothetical protein n=1 Tax=uncultured Deefgea sp. TaxID=1304914 RepID=UPI00261EA190|nr:hypothetical protein [uncultured Deefgea sp.]
MTYGINIGGLESLDLKQFIENYNKLPDQKSVTIGVHKDEDARSDGATNSLLLAVHEFGNAKIPARRPLRISMTQPAFREAAAKIGTAVTPKEQAGALREMGQVGVRAVRNVIDRGLTPKILDTTTRKNKSSDRGIALKDTEQLYKSLKYEVQS